MTESGKERMEDVLPENKERTVEVEVGGDANEMVMWEFVQQAKTYCKIDYDDDEDILRIIVDATMEKLQELIPNFNPYAMTARQKLLAMSYIKDQYDHADAYQKEEKKLSNAAASMLLSEMYGGGA